MRRRTIKKLRYTIFILAAILIGLVITKAVIVDAETDDFIQETDAFIAKYEAETKTAKNDAEIKKIVKKTEFATISDENLTPASLEPTEDWVEMSPEEFQVAGIIDWNGWRYTYYSEQVLPGEGLNIPGRWSDGTFVRDENGYLCVACNDLDQGTVVATPFGDAIVYDWVGDDVTGIIDIYVSW